MAVIIITEEAAHHCMPKQLMKSRLFNIGPVAVVFLQNIYSAIIEHARHRRLDALRRRTSENGMWQLSECPGFLNRHRQRGAGLPGDGVVDVFDGATQLGPPDGRMCFLLDGVRVVYLGAREERLYMHARPRKRIRGSARR